MTPPWPLQESSQQDYTPLIVQQTAGVSWIYFIGNPEGTRIKVGYSKHLPRRMKQHQQGHAFASEGENEYLAFVRGTRSDETAITSYFKAARWKPTTTEEFHADPLIPYITWLRDQYFVSVTLEEARGESGHVVMDPSMWLPRPERESTRVTDGLLAMMGPWAFLPSRDVMGDDWYTPPDIIDAARSSLEWIDLDPASHITAQQTVKARQCYTKDQDGLAHPWHGRVWLNPPFSDWKQWASKTLEELQRGQVEEMILLGFTRTLSAQYFEPLLRRVDALCIVTGRRVFWGKTSDSESAPDGIFLMYVGNRVERFRSHFNGIGPTWAAKP